MARRDRLPPITITAPASTPPWIGPCELCARRGARLTRLRRRVLELVWQGHAAVKAYDLLAELDRKDATAKPPTVYRALDFLMAHGLVHRLESLNSYVGCPQPGAPARRPVPDLRRLRQRQRVRGVGDPTRHSDCRQPISALPSGQQTVEDPRRLPQLPHVARAVRS